MDAQQQLGINPSVLPKSMTDLASQRKEQGAQDVKALEGIESKRAGVSSAEQQALGAQPLPKMPTMDTSVLHKRQSS